MIRKLLNVVGLTVHTAITVMYARDIFKERLDKVASKETAKNKTDYVLIRFARGDYNKPGGFKQMQNDYKFYDLASGFHTMTAIKPDRIPKPRKKE